MGQYQPCMLLIYRCGSYYRGLPSQAGRLGSRTLHSAFIRRARRSLHAQALGQDTSSNEVDETVRSRLNPTPDDYGRQIFADKCRLKLYAGSGGNGCVSFLRDKFIAEGPPNGGDGGSGGSIYIQAISGETSLHKLARQGSLRAGRGRNGQGKSKGGPRGEDLFIQVPVGTVVREIARLDPVAVEEASRRKDHQAVEGKEGPAPRRHKWIIYPKATAQDLSGDGRPVLPRPRRPDLATLQPQAPIYLDLSKPMEEPKLLVAGARGGLGNPHFTTKSNPRPQFATKGNGGTRLELEFELKILADLGFVGYPNAGKSTVLRALSRSRARVGDWAFTTLQPNIGTVVLDDNHGPARIHAVDSTGQRLTRLSIADIPGIIPDAHLDRGLGLDFLRHIERARVLAFVVDLGEGDAVETLKSLWRELAAFEQAKIQPAVASGEVEIIDWKQFGDSKSGTRTDATNAASKPSTQLQELQLPPISTKPWFVVGTKSDKEGTQENFERLRAYLAAVESGKHDHPAGAGDGKRWGGQLKLVPISAIRGHGVDAISLTTVNLLTAVGG
jgi:GTPase